jgi:hypothetical protein
METECASCEVTALLFYFYDIHLFAYMRFIHAEFSAAVVTMTHEAELTKQRRSVLRRTVLELATDCAEAWSPSGTPGHTDVLH